MKVFYAALSTETNSFSSIPTARAAFALGQRRGAEVLDDNLIFGPSARHLRDLVEAEGGELALGVFAFAQPGAPTVQAVYEELRDALLEDLRAAGPVDMVVLLLHGAMMADEVWDCEGDILQRVRQVVGNNTPVGAVLDPHAHLTNDMIESATVLAFQKEYPHTDLLDRLGDVWRLCVETLRGRIAPAAAVHDCKMVSIWPTGREPMRGFVDRMMALEGVDGILSVSFVHGFAWGDTPVTGAKMLVYADGDAEKAQMLASRLGREVWNLRNEVLTPLASLSDALKRIETGAGAPLVLADVADNPGGGAPSDATHVLRAVLDRGITGVGFGIFYDRVAVEFCHEAGLGSKLSLRIGGKISPESGAPIDLDVQVMGLAKDASQSVLGSGHAPLGDAAWVRGRGIDVILSSERVQCFDPTAFSNLGLDPKQLDAVVVKSTNHFRAGFDPIARDTIYLNSPGAIPNNFAEIPYRVFKAPYWPKTEHPDRTH